MHYIWHTQEDSKVRSSHAANDGEIFAWDQAPEGGKHPSEDYGCRCWAEPYISNGTILKEDSEQNVIWKKNDKKPAWDNGDLWNHYNQGNGQAVVLSDIGLLEEVIDYSNSFYQLLAGGGSVFNRVALKIFIEVRQKGQGSFSGEFGRPYIFHFATFSFGSSTVKGTYQAHVVDKGDSLIISAKIEYNFNDEYRDALDVFNRITSRDIEWPGAKPFGITDTWTTRLEAIIKKNSDDSIYPNNKYASVLAK